MSNYSLPGLLVLTALLIAFATYKPGTYLTGWDTLHPEFNFKINFQRLINGVWRENQGLGAVAAHSHMADLPRVIILWGLHFFFPLNTLRYLYVFLCLIIGPIGMYYLVKLLFVTPSEESVTLTPRRSNFADAIAFLAGFFYLLNPGTVQQFYVPFEMFPTQYAFLPLIILFSIKFLRNPNKKHLGLFALFNLLATPQTYAAHLWYPLFGLFLLFLFFYYLLEKTNLKNNFVLIIIMLAVNSFWLLPNIYYVMTSTKNPQIYRLNRLHSKEFLLRNRETGNLKSVPLNHGFYFNWGAFDFEQWKGTKLMPEWRNHFSNFDILIFGYFLFSCSIAGLTLAIKEKDKLLISLSPFLVIPFILLANRVPPFNYFFEFLLNFSTLKEILRFIYTKVSISYQFGLTIFFAFILKLLFTIITEKKRLIIIIGLTLGLIFYSFPAFQGNLISKKMKVKIPDYYFQFWDYMNKEENGRVLTLPIHQSTGWQYYDWGYQGAGFIWFGMKQPILDRDFDRWETANAQNYNEFYFSIYSNQPEKFSSKLEKYNIKYLVWDSSLTTTQPKNITQITFQNEIDRLINNLIESGYLDFQVKHGTIRLYKTNFDTPLVSTHQQLPAVGPQYLWGYQDSAYSKFGSYLTKDNNQVYYPFRNFIDENGKVNINKIGLRQVKDNWQIELKAIDNQRPNLPELNNIKIPGLCFITKEDTSLIVNINFSLPDHLKDNIKKTYKIDLPDNTNQKYNLQINNRIFNLDLSKEIKNKELGWVYFQNNSNSINQENINIFGNLNYNQPETIKLSNLPAEKYNQQILNSFFGDNKNTLYSPAGLRISNSKETTSLPIFLPNLSHQAGYLIGIESKFVSGLPLRICLKNLYTGQCSIEDEIYPTEKFSYSWFFAPSTDLMQGYNLELNNISQGGEKTVNWLKNVVVLPIPDQYLNKTYYSKNNLDSFKNQQIGIDTQPKVTGVFKINSEDMNSEDYLRLNYSYNPGWLAVYFDGWRPKILKDHVLINNWANGWDISPLTTSHEHLTPIYLVFWPQLLQFLGFGLLIATTISILIPPTKSYDRSV